MRNNLNFFRTTKLLKIGITAKIGQLIRFKICKNRNI